MGIRSLFGTLLLLLILTGSGCVDALSGQTRTHAEEAQALTLQEGSSIVMESTVFGVGGTLLKLVSGPQAVRTVTVSSYEPGSSASLDWEVVADQETEASLEARQAWLSEYGSAGVGQDVPPQPEPVFESTTTHGSVSSSDLGSGSLLALPGSWLVGENQKADGSLIWLSKESFLELRDTRRTSINLGLFDESLARALSVADQVSGAIQQLRQEANAASDEQDIQAVTADPSFGTYALKIDGKTRRVETIEASNWFAKYTILNNEENPLILEITLTPASLGSVNVFSPAQLLQAFFGYQVTAINS